MSRAQRRAETAPIANAPSGAGASALSADVRPVATPDRELHMIGNAHIDPVWLWTWQEGYQEARATFRSALDRMDEYPDFIFTCDQMVLLEWVEEQDPEMFARIQQRVDEGRWVNVGGWWVEPDNNMPMGESFVRQGLYGQRYLREKFGRIATVGMNVDPFGHSATLPMILRGQRMDSYAFLRPGPHESDFSGTLFHWESPDGSRVLAHRIPFEYTSGPGDVAHQTEKALAQLDKSLGQMMVFYGVGNHGGGPTKMNIDSIHRYDRMGTFGRMKMSSPRTYFDEMYARGDAFLDGLDVRRDDLQHHAPGCYSSHSGIKAWQRRAQRAVLTAERWAAIDGILTGAEYPREDFARAWKQILFNQFHDILPGSAIEPSYEDARDQLGEAVAIAKRITARAHNRIARRIDIPLDPETQPVIVFNPHPWAVSVDVDLQYGGQRTGVRIVDADGRRVRSQPTQSTATTGDVSRGAVTFRAEVPALGYARYTMLPGRDDAQKSQIRVSDDGTEFENGVLRVRLDPATGDVVSLLDLRTGIDVLAGTEGEPRTVINDDPTDTWGHRVISYAWEGASMSLDRIVVRERGPLRARILVERSWGSSTLTQELVLSHDSDALRIENTLDWRERAHLMKLRFPVGITEPEATYEIPFGVIQRPVDGAEEPAQSWVDLTGQLGSEAAGLTVICTNKHGWDASPAGYAGAQVPSIGVTAVRSPVYSWHDPRLLDPDGVYSYQDQGIQRFRMELVPHAGDWRAAQPTRRAAVLEQPVRAQLESFHDGDLAARGSYADDAGGSVMVTAVKGSEDLAADGSTDLIVRAVETRGEASRARIELPVLDRVVEAEFEPFQLRTFRVPADPAAPITEVDLLEWPLDEDV